MRHPCAGTVWALDFDRRGEARCAFCASRAAGRGSEYPHSVHLVRRALSDQLKDWRRRRLPKWVWLNPHGDAYVEGARDLGALTGEIMKTLASRRIGALIHTRGGMPAGDSLVLVARRFPALLRVDLGFFSSRKEVCRAWERGAASIDARLELLEALTKAGVEVGVRLGPIVPSANDDASDWADLFASLARLGVREVVPIWLESSRRLLAQIRREISPEIAHRLEFFTQSADDMLFQGWRVATLNMMRHMASPLGIDVKRCRCGPDTAGASSCLVGPAEAQKDRQLALFG